MKVPSIEFHENPSSEHWGQTDG